MFAHITFVLIKKEETDGSCAEQEIEGSEQTSFKFYCVAEVTPGNSGRSLVLYLVMPLRSLDSHLIQIGASFEILLYGLGWLIGVSKPQVPLI